MTPASPRDAAPSHSLRVATWNVASCRRGFAGVAKVVRALDADILAAQEVDRGTQRCGGIDQAEALARETGYPHYQFFRATTMHRGDYGLAILSRFPITGARVGMLPTLLGLEQRILASAVIDLPRTQIAVHVTHLSQLTTRWQLRAEQARRVMARIGAASMPALLFGDFNDRPDTPVHRTITDQLVDVFQSVGRGPAGTYPLPLLRDMRIDYIFASRDVHLRRADVVPTRASDHHAVRADIHVPAIAPGGLLAMAR